LTPNRKLKSLYGTTEPDLAANRNGEITPRQVQWLHGKRGENQIKGAFLFFLSLGLAAVGGYQSYLYFRNPVGNPPTLWVILLVAGGILAIVLPIAVRREGDNMSEDIKVGRVEQQAGVGWRQKRVVRNKYGSQTYYYVRVGDFNMGAVDEDTYNAFLSDHCYRVYYLPRSRHIVSVEQIDCSERNAPPPKPKQKNAPEVEMPLNKEISFLVYSLRGQGTYTAAIKWYIAKDKPPKVAWQKQGDDTTTLNQEALQRLPNIANGMQNQGWEVTDEKDEGEISDNATFRRVYTMERVRVENETR
jgi:hypothetical protein